MSATTWVLFLIMLLILGNGFFAAAEIAIINARRGRLKSRADTGDRPSQLAIDLQSQPEGYCPRSRLVSR